MQNILPLLLLLCLLQTGITGAKGERVHQATELKSRKAAQLDGVQGTSTKQMRCAPAM